MKVERLQKTVAWLGVLILFLNIFLAIPVLVVLYASPVEFNQFLIQRLRLRYGTLTISEAVSGAESIYLAGLNFIRRWDTEKPSFEDPQAVFDYIFSMLPAKATVYPTEGFYYWNSRLDDMGDISGNLRLADLRKGSISFAYFTTGNKEPQRTKYFDASVKNGLTVKDSADGTFVVGHKGREVRFKMPDIISEHTPRLLSHEDFVGRIYDEAAIPLYIVFNRETNSFYEFLDEDSGPAEEYEQGDNNLILGKRTAFVYYNDVPSDRKILIGTYLPNSELNNYLDGPADQVPFWLNLRPLLHIAYPATMLGDGVDEHGVYLNREEWMRIAVSPYHRYSDINDLIEKAKECVNITEDSYRLTCLTKEWWNTSRFIKSTLKNLKVQGKSYPETILERVKYYEQKVASVRDEV